MTFFHFPTCLALLLGIFASFVAVILTATYPMLAVLVDGGGWYLRGTGPWILLVAIVLAQAAALTSLVSDREFPFAGVAALAFLLATGGALSVSLGYSLQVAFSSLPVVAAIFFVRNKARWASFVLASSDPRVYYIKCLMPAVLGLALPLLVHAAGGPPVDRKFLQQVGNEVCGTELEAMVDKLSERGTMEQFLRAVQALTVIDNELEKILLRPYMCLVKKLDSTVGWSNAVGSALNLLYLRRPEMVRCMGEKGCDQQLSSLIQKLATILRKSKNPVLQQFYQIQVKDVARISQYSACHSNTLIKALSLWNLNWNNIQVKTDKPANQCAIGVGTVMCSSGLVVRSGNSFSYQEDVRLVMEWRMGDDSYSFIEYQYDTDNCSGISEGVFDKYMRTLDCQLKNSSWFCQDGRITFTPGSITYRGD